jgi:hypothetical protein
MCQPTPKKRKLPRALSLRFSFGFEAPQPKQPSCCHSTFLASFGLVAAMIIAVGFSEPLICLFYYSLFHFSGACLSGSKL